jgi:type IV secretion system protein TrbE
MLRLDHVIKPWKESGALNSQINLYGFWNEQAFLTKSGGLGIVLRVRGVDYESLDQAGQEYAVKRLEAALKTFGVGFHVYQYLFKTSRPDIPFQKYEDPVLQAAVDQRKEFFRQKLDRLFDIEIFYAIVNGWHRANLFGWYSTRERHLPNWTKLDHDANCQFLASA